GLKEWEPGTAGGSATGVTFSWGEAYSGVVLVHLVHRLRLINNKALARIIHENVQQENQLVVPTVYSRRPAHVDRRDFAFCYWPQGSDGFTNWQCRSTSRRRKLPEVRFA